MDGCASAPWEGALRLLAWSAQDPSLRRTAFAAPSRTSHESLLHCLLRGLDSHIFIDKGVKQQRSNEAHEAGSKEVHCAVAEKGEEQQQQQQQQGLLSLEGMWSTVSLLSHFLTGNSDDLCAMREAGQPLLLLLRLHAAIPHTRAAGRWPQSLPATNRATPAGPCSHVLVTARAAAVASGKPPCCMVAHAAASCAAKMCALDRALLRSDLLDHRDISSSQLKGPGLASKTGQLQRHVVPGAGLYLLIDEAKRVLQACPEALRPEVDSNLTVIGYAKGRAPVDACPPLQCKPGPGKPSPGRGPPSRQLMPVALPASSPQNAPGPQGGSSAASGRQHPATAKESALASQQDQSLVVKWLEILAALASGGRALAFGLYSLEVTGLLKQMGQAFSSHLSVVHAVEVVYGALARNCQAVMDEAMAECNVHALIGIIKHASNSSCSSNPAEKPAADALRALSKLAQVVDTCSATDFMQLIRKDGVLDTVLPLLDKSKSCPSGTSVSPVMVDAAQCLFLGSLDRARRARHLEPTQVPRLAFFGTLQPQALQQLEKHTRKKEASSSPDAQPSGTHTSSRSKGSSQAGKGLRRPGGDGCGQQSWNGRQVTQGRACRVESEDVPKQSPTRKAAVPSNSNSSKSANSKADCGEGKEAAAEDGYDSDGVKLVWTSGPALHVHAARLQWQAVPLAERMRWDQSSDSIMVWLQLPSGTTKRDVTVDVSSVHLTVRLGWAGRVLDGPLTRKVKASEALWVIETGSSRGSSSSIPSSTDTQLHIVLPKCERHYWRSVFQGGLEKSHVEVLREAVEADEPVVGYDDMDEEAKNLVEDFRERQWMISNGHLSMENSIDDFRVVVGDNTL